MDLKAKTRARARLCWWLLVGLLVTSVGASVQSHAQRTPPVNRYKHDYEFTADWFWPSVRKWELLLAEFKGQPNFSYLEVGPFDLIYIDGSHSTNDVMADVVLSWGLLKVGGMLIMDDYRWHTDWPIGLRPGFAINSFISAYSREIEIVRRKPNDNQIFLRKKVDRCLALHYEGCSYLGDYFYDWRNERTLYRASDLSKIDLTRQEKQLVERIIKTKGMGDVKLEIDNRLRSHKLFDQLNNRLNLGL